MVDWNGLVRLTCQSLAIRNAAEVNGHRSSGHSSPELKYWLLHFITM